MKISSFSLIAAAAFALAAFSVSCESDSDNALSPFWDEGGLNSAKDPGSSSIGDNNLSFDPNDPRFKTGDPINGSTDINGPGQYGENLNAAPYIDGFGAKINGVTFQPVYFQYDQNSITASEEAKVAAVAQYLLEHPEAGVVIEGYCDERGTEEYNRALGERRALAAKLLLLDVYGIAESRTKTVSYGEERPAATGTGDSIWAQNRRDEFVPVYLKGAAN